MTQTRNNYLAIMVTLFPLILPRRGTREDYEDVRVV